MRRSEVDPLSLELPSRGRAARPLRDLAHEQRRFGYRRLFVLLRREGEPSGINRIYRLYCEEGLAVHERRAQRKAVGIRAPIPVEAGPTRAGRWTLSIRQFRPRHRVHLQCQLA